MLRVTSASIVGVQLRSLSSLQQQSPINPYVKRGGTGRAAFSGQVATVFGGTGFIGQSLVSRLCKLGYQVNVPYRGELYHIRGMRVSGELGQLQFCPFSAKEPESIARAMKYSNVVINLIGRNWQTSNFSFDDVHIDVAASIAREAKRLGVPKLIHFSSMNASTSPPRFYTRTGSKFLVSKAKGEDAVLAEFPDVYIVRPADVYGWNDSFLSYYSHMFRRSILFRSVPLYSMGRKTFKMPVSVHNVVDGVTELASPDCDIPAGEILEFYGPSAYSLHDIISYLIRCLRKNARPTPMLPTTLLKVFLTSKVMPNTREVNMDRLEREFVTDLITVPYGLHNLLSDDQMQSIPYMWPHICRYYCTYLTHGETFENQPESDCLQPISLSQFCKNDGFAANSLMKNNALLA